MGNFHVGGRADDYVARLIAFSDIQNTVHLVFAFLFGWGLAQSWGKGGSGLSLVSANTRKLLALFLIGMANACLFDPADETLIPRAS